jgi:hypothetical protein
MLGKAQVVIAVLALASPTALAASNQEKPQALIVRRSAIPGRVIVLDLGLHFATAIRMSEPVSSVVAGDPALFKVEHSEREPRLVFVKPLSLEPVQSNLLISTVGGRSVSLLVRTEHTATNAPSNDAGPARPVHFLLDLNPAAGFLIDEATETSMLIEQTVPLARAVAVRSGGRLVPGPTENTLNQLLTEQEFTNLRSVQGSPLGVSASRIYEIGRRIFVLFSVLNRGKQTVELLTPQVQLSGFGRKGNRSVEQLAVVDYRLNRKKLKPGERADGVMEFERPTFKHSHQVYLLQIADSAAVDRPSLVAIDLGQSLPLKEDQ